MNYIRSWLAFELVALALRICPNGKGRGLLAAGIIPYLENERTETQQCLDAIRKRRGWSEKHGGERGEY